jgi:hypothetical protein
MKYAVALIAIGIAALIAQSGHAFEVKDPALFNQGLQNIYNMATPPRAQQFERAPQPQTNPWAGTQPQYQREPVCYYTTTRDAWGNVRTIRVCE